MPDEPAPIIHTRLGNSYIALSLFVLCFCSLDKVSTPKTMQAVFFSSELLAGRCGGSSKLLREQVRSECHISFFRKSVGDTFDMIGQSYYLVNYNNRRAGSLHGGSCQVGLDGACLAVICRHGAQFICHC